MRPEDVQYWDEWKGKLTQPQRNKARKFVDLIEYGGGGKFFCKPLEGYNTTTHVIEPDRAYGWRCSCQGFITKKRDTENGTSMIRPFCAHIHALLLAFSKKKFDRWHVRLEEGDFHG